MKKLFFIICFLYTSLSFSQGSLDYGGGLKFNLNPEGTKYMRIISWNQIWFRSTEMNPGTKIGDESVSHFEDIGLRRLRILSYAQISPRYMIVTHIGINNQTFINGGAAGSANTGGYGAGKKPGLFYHAAWNEYVITNPKGSNPFSLTIGGGLHYYMGLSRMTMASTLNFLTVDAPIFNWPLIENSDQFARQIGFFAKGKYNHFEYRVSINKPYSTNQTPVNVSNASLAKAVDNNNATQWSKAGYFEYQIFDKESNLLPYKVGTYIGTKKIFNIGGGFYYAPKGTQTSVNGVIEEHPINLLALDAFLDMPIGDKDKKMAITAYSVFYNYDFGPKYLRNIGIMNEGSVDQAFNGTPSLAGPGNLQPTIGTGKIWYTQAGVVLPNNNEKPKVRIQPFGAFTYKNFEALDKASNQFDIGANFFLDGHNAKITTQYSTRPVYSSLNNSKSKGEFILQLHIYL